MTRRSLELISNNVIRRIFENEDVDVETLVERELRKHFPTYDRFEKLKKSEMIRETKEFMRMIVGI